MDSTSTLAQAKTAVFGPSPALGTDGQPLERGVGSSWYRAEHIQKAHFHAATAWAACDELVAAAKSLLASAEKISAAVKASVEAANAAKGDIQIMTVPTVPDLIAPAPAPPAIGITDKPIVPAENHTLDFAAVPSTPEK